MKTYYVITLKRDCFSDEGIQYKTIEEARKKLDTFDLLKDRCVIFKITEELVS